jgi:hypothetical protein
MLEDAFFAADVLLARLQRQHKSAVALVILPSRPTMRPAGADILLF